MGVMQRQAKHVEDIDAAVKRFMPVTPDDPFYVSFDNLRGSFQERKVMKRLNVSGLPGSYRFEPDRNRFNKTFLFLAGMRGSGKTSELARYAKELHTPACFFVITCNVDTELDMDKIQYMDILVFQLEKLLAKTANEGLNLDDSVLESMNVWFDERVKEINRSLKSEGSAELEVGGDADNPFSSVTGLLGKLLGVTAKLKAGLSGSYERATAIRTTLKNRFSDFATKFNIFIEQTNDQLRRQKLGQEVLFIVDGLEKTFSTEVRRAIIIDEANRIQSIRANTIFTLPIELMNETQRIRQTMDAVSFPFIKICDRNGNRVDAAYERFEEMVCKRVDINLFDAKDTLWEAITYSGGSPRQLLEIIERASWEADETLNKITRADLETALDELANEVGRYVEPDEFIKLREVRELLDSGKDVGFDSVVQALLEKQLLFEYNDGGYKRVNPLLERSRFYRQRVLT